MREFGTWRVLRNGPRIIPPCAAGVAPGLENGDHREAACLRRGTGYWAAARSTPLREPLKSARASRASRS